MATFLQNLKTARDNAAAALAASVLSTDSPEHVDKLLSLIERLNQQIDEAAMRDAETGERVPFEIETRGV